MLTRIGTWTRAQLALATPWSNVYGVARTILAGAMAMTLLCTQSENLFRPSTLTLSAPMCGGMMRAGLFCLVDSPHLDVARWLSVAALLLVASGWRPQITGVLHWYVALSFEGSATVVEGGDQVCTILALLLVPVTLTDPRRWHWDAPPSTPAPPQGELRRLIAAFALLVARIQVAGIYFDASMGKVGAPTWGTGTAIYYWFTHPTFGAPDWLLPLLRSSLSYAPIVCAVTYGTIMVEFALFVGLFLSKRAWPPLLVLGMGLHAGIILIHGLASFGLVMMAALVLFLRPHERPFSLAWRPRRAVAPALHVEELALAAE